MAIIIRHVSLLYSAKREQRTHREMHRESRDTAHTLAGAVHTSLELPRVDLAVLCEELIASTFHVIDNFNSASTRLTCPATDEKYPHRGSTPPGCGYP